MRAPKPANPPPPADPDPTCRRPHSRRRKEAADAPLASDPPADGHHPAPGPDRGGGHGRGRSDAGPQHVRLWPARRHRHPHRRDPARWQPGRDPVAVRLRPARQHLLPGAARADHGAALWPRGRDRRLPPGGVHLGPVAGSALSDRGRGRLAARGGHRAAGLSGHRRLFGRIHRRHAQRDAHGARLGGPRLGHAGGQAAGDRRGRPGRHAQCGPVVPRRGQALRLGQLAGQ